MMRIIMAIRQSAVLQVLLIVIACVCLALLTEKLGFSLNDIFGEPATNFTNSASRIWPFGLGR
jgi:hypothetical protein